MQGVMIHMFVIHVFVIHGLLLHVLCHQHAFLRHARMGLSIAGKGIRRGCWPRLSITIQRRINKIGPRLWGMPTPSLAVIVHEKESGTNHRQERKRPNPPEPAEAATQTEVFDKADGNQQESVDLMLASFSIMM